MNVQGDFRYVDFSAYDECTDFLAYLDDCKYEWENAFVSWVSVSKNWKEERKLSQNHWGPWNLVKVLKFSLLYCPFLHKSFMHLLHRIYGKQTYF